MLLLLVYVSLALGVSFLCSIMEAVLLSLTPAFIEQCDQEGHPAAARLRRLKDDIDRPLSAILSLNTIAHTVGAMGAGAQAAIVFGSAFVGISSAILTLLILVVSEIIPKTLGAVHWRKLAPIVARLLGPLMWLLWPLVWLSQIITQKLTKGDEGEMVDRDEISAMAVLAERQGVLEGPESTLLVNIMRLRELKVKDVMTPRTVVARLAGDQSVDDVFDEVQDMDFSRIPIYREHPEQLSGYVLKDDILLRAARGEGATRLDEIQREFLSVNENEPLTRMLERLVEGPGVIAYVTDRYGGLSGIVTLEDVVETLIGLEIVDESDSVADLQKLARERADEAAESAEPADAEPLEQRP